MYPLEPKSLNLSATSSLRGPRFVPFEGFRAVMPTHGTVLSLSLNISSAKGRRRGRTSAIRLYNQLDSRSLTGEQKMLEEQQSWPSQDAREAGFGRSFPETIERMKLTVTGEIPPWLSGVLIRNGPGSYENGTPEGMNHMFDGYGALLKLEINGKTNSVVMSHKFVDSMAWRHIKRTGSMRWREFGTSAPSRNVWDKLSNTLGTILGSLGFSQGVTDNASVNIIPRGDGTWWALTETIAGTLAIDPDTLGTLGAVSYDDTLSGPSGLTTAHPSILKNGDLINIISAPGSGFKLYRIRDKPSDTVVDAAKPTRFASRTVARREIVASLPHRHALSPAWIHDFPSTENYAILVESPLYFNLSSLMLDVETPYIFMDWRPEERTRVRVIRLRDGAVVSCDIPPCFVFHYANAWEEYLDVDASQSDAPSRARNGSETPADTLHKGATRVHIDAAVYEDPSILNHLKLKNMRSGFKEGVEIPSSYIRRLTLEISKEFDRVRLVKPSGTSHRSVQQNADVVHPRAPPSLLDVSWTPLAADESQYGNFVEFPSVNPDKRGEKHRYVWGTCAVRPTSQAQGLAKWDIDTGDTLVWAELGGAVNEPLFVPRPGADAEDDGILIATVIQPDGKTALVMLDGRRHEVLARAVLTEGTMTIGFHGSFDLQACID